MEELAGWEEPPAAHLEAEFWSSPDCWSKWSWTENVPCAYIFYTPHFSH